MESGAQNPAQPPQRCLPEDVPSPEWWPLADTMGTRGGSPIYTFTSQFADVSEFNAASEDVEFLDSLDLSELFASGAADAPILRLMVSSAEGHLYSEDNMPTPATLVTDLKATHFKSAIADLNASGPLQYLRYLVFPCCDEVHQDKEKQYIFSTTEDLESLEDDDNDREDRETALRSMAQLMALKQYVLKQRLYFVLIHTDRRQFAIDAYLSVHEDAEHAGDEL